MNPTYEEIAENYQLWEEYVDPDGLQSEADFEAMSVKEKIEWQRECFSPDNDNLYY
jgi:hypothetical protein